MQVSNVMTPWEEVHSIPRSLEEGGPVDGGYAARLVHS